MMGERLIPRLGWVRSMSEFLAPLGGILFQAGAVAALIIVTPALYGVVIAMRRWWLVLFAAAMMLALVARITFDSQLAEAARLLPEPMVPNTAGFVTVAITYVLLAVVIRLSTLRLEWLGWKAKSIKDIHVLGYLAPTLAAFYLALPVF